jgi:AAA15 family ATPase/GTPase
MLDSLHIQNYRLFKDLKIDKLGQVNLIAGKNNTGKTALLEALRIMILAADTTFCNIIYLRGDYYPNDKHIYSTLFPNKDYNNKTILFDFFYNKKEERFKIKYGHQKKKYSFFLITEMPKDEEAIELGIVQNPQNFDRQSDSLFLSFQNDENLTSELWKRVSLTPKEEDVIDIMNIIDKRIVKVRVDDKKSRVLLNCNSAKVT